jgi:hypothetical protein
MTVRANGRGRFAIQGLLSGARVRFLKFGAEPLLLL